MTRKRKPDKRRGTSSGVLVGMRGKVRNLARGAGGPQESDEKPKSQWRGKNLVWNIVTGIALIVAGALFLRRCGVVKF